MLCLPSSLPERFFAAPPKQCPFVTCAVVDYAGNWVVARMPGDFLAYALGKKREIAYYSKVLLRWSWPHLSGSAGVSINESRT
jgi:hypothetical protein